MPRFQPRRNAPSVLAAALLTLASVVGVMAQASPAAAREVAPSLPPDNSPRTSSDSPSGRTLKITLRSDGKAMAVLTIAQEEGTKMMLHGNTISFRSGGKHETITLTNDVTIKITRGQTTILSLTADDAVIETIQEEK